MTLAAAGSFRERGVMNLLRQRRLNVVVELLLGAVVQVGLSRALCRACRSAEEREVDLPHRIRPWARPHTQKAPTR